MMLDRFSAQPEWPRARTFHPHRPRNQAPAPAPGTLATAPGGASSRQEPPVEVISARGRGSALPRKGVWRSKDHLKRAPNPLNARTTTRSEPQSVLRARSNAFRCALWCAPGADSRGHSRRIRRSSGQEVPFRGRERTARRRGGGGQGGIKILESPSMKLRDSADACRGNCSGSTYPGVGMGGSRTRGSGGARSGLVDRRSKFPLSSRPLFNRTGAFSSTQRGEQDPLPSPGSGGWPGALRDQGAGWRARRSFETTLATMMRRA